MNILITGGSGGLGRALVACLALNPENHVFFTYNSSLKAAEELEQKFRNSKKLRCDFHEPESVGALLGNIEGLKLDALVNNAALRFSPVHFQKIPCESFENGFRANVLAALRITQAVLMKFRAQKSGRIVTILSSALVSNPPAGWSQYAAEKNYLLAMSRSWAAENAAFNISSNCVSPSFMATEFNGQIDPRVVESLIGSHPLKRLLTVEETAETVKFLLNATRQLNGQNLVLNAGQVL